MRPFAPRDSDQTLEEGTNGFLVFPGQPGALGTIPEVTGDGCRVVGEELSEPYHLTIPLEHQPDGPPAQAPLELAPRVALQDVTAARRSPEPAIPFGPIEASGLPRRVEGGGSRRLVYLYGRVFADVGFHSSPHLLSRPETSFAVAHGVRPVGDVVGHLVRLRFRELDEQAVVSPFAVKEAHAQQIARSGRGCGLSEPVPDDLRPRPPEVTDRLPQERPRHVAAPWERREVEYVAVLSR